MKQKQSSTTAEGMALVRAIEASRPPDKRICYDPIARALANPMSVFLSKLVIDSGIYDRFFAPGVGAIEFITAREQYIDDFLKACLSEGLAQVVILGAGFDTATLAERLLASSYNEQGKTLFIWQGVTMYLTPKGIDSTLAFITNHSGRDSAVIFDYFYNETLRDMKMKTTRRITRAIGEQLIFGIDEGQIEPFLTRRGFRDVRNADAEELTRLYFTGPNAGRAISTGVAIASARVDKSL